MKKRSIIRAMVILLLTLITRSGDSALNCPPGTQPMWTGNLNPTPGELGYLGNHFIGDGCGIVYDYLDITMSWGKYWVSIYRDSKQGSQGADDTWAKLEATLKDEIKQSNASGSNINLDFEFIGYTHTASEAWAHDSALTRKVGPYTPNENEIIEAEVYQMVYRVKKEGWRRRIFSLTYKAWVSTEDAGTWQFSEVHRTQSCQ